MANTLISGNDSVQKHSMTEPLDRKGEERSLPDP